MWEVETTDAFDKWFDVQTEALKEDMLAAMMILSEYGPQLGRPFADTVNASAFSNMKELRVQHQGSPIRAFFAFDPSRHSIVLCAGDKTGLNEKKFYKEMIRLADAEYRNHLIRRKIMATLKELMAKQSPESQERITEKVEILRQAVALNMLREELNLSQAELASAMGVKQPTIAKMEQADNDPRLSTLKRYVTALGGELSIDVKLPTGKRVAFYL